MPRHLFVGGLIAIAFDPAERYLLTVSHSGCGVFDTRTWERVARESGPSYPKSGRLRGIGPLADLDLEVVELDLSGPARFASPSGRLIFEYDSGAIAILHE